MNDSVTAASVSGEAGLTLLCLLFCALATVVLQRLSLAPPAPPAREAPDHAQARPVPRPAGDALAALIGLAPACLFLLLTARPVLSALLVLALWLLLLVLNRAKVRILREPLVLADAWLIGQIARYPGMYFPFLPMRRIAAGFFLVLGLLVLLWQIEPPLGLLRLPMTQALLAALAGSIPLLVLLMRHGRLRRTASALLRLCPVSHDAMRDSRENGTLTASLLHPVWAGVVEHGQGGALPSPPQDLSRGDWPQSFVRPLLALNDLPPEHRPHVLIVQAESFCDIRLHVPEPQRRALEHFLPNWDRLTAAGRTLPTPEGAFGAYTMRTEFSVLTGMRRESLGPWAFNPYLLAARRPLWSLARHFADQGYDTLCLHPYHKDFFRRDKVMPNLGFRRFQGLEELGRLEHFGPHVSDLALGRELLSLMAASHRPLFAFVITIEAHSPWTAGRLRPEQIAQTLPDIDRSLFREDMLLYLCHLRHMDMLFGLLQEGLPCAGPRPGAPLLWVYGDHAPGLDMGGAAQVLL